jgi:hypothetical protein
MSVSSPTLRLGLHNQSSDVMRGKSTRWSARFAVLGKFEPALSQQNFNAACSPFRSMGFARNSSAPRLSAKSRLR